MCDIICGMNIEMPIKANVVRIPYIYRVEIMAADC